MVPGTNPPTLDYERHEVEPEENQRITAAAIVLRSIGALVFLVFLLYLLLVWMPHL